MQSKNTDGLFLCMIFFFELFVVTSDNNLSLSKGTSTKWFVRTRTKAEPYAECEDAVNEHPEKRTTNTSVTLPRDGKKNRTAALQLKKIK